jgi:hypothetical protein
MDFAELKQLAYQQLMSLNVTAEQAQIPAQVQGPLFVNTPIILPFR